jgi:molybdopterin/thiamine biosynthesis adenylyltransferase
MDLDQQEFQQEKMKNNSVERYSNHLMLKEIGGYGQKLLKESKVLIVGLGGLGCPVLQYAAGSGIGTIGLIDNDDIEISNLHRQTIFSINDIGKPKVEIAEKFSNFINPETKTIIYKDTLNKKNAKKIIKDYDFIVDCTDNNSSKLIINDECFNNSKPLIYASVSGFFGQVSTFKSYKKDKNNTPYPSYRCLKIQETNENDCDHIGVLGSIAGVIGSLQATELIKQITNNDDNLIGKLLIFDGLTNNIRIIRINWDSKNILNGTG